MSNERDERAEQLALVSAKRKPTRKRAAQPLAHHDPVARVLVDVSLPHLDRLFDYAIPARFDLQAKPGVRVRVRFAGRLVDGFLIERLAHSTFDGKLAPIASVVSDEVVLTSSVLELAREVAARGAGSLIDVVRAAVPDRHARAEAASTMACVKARTVPGAFWASYHGGEAFMARLGEPVRAVWTQIPHDVHSLAQAVSAAPGGVIVVVPNRRHLDVLRGSFDDLLGCESYRELSAELGPEARYQAFTAILRGEVRIVVGTRSAVFAPVHNLSLIVVLDDTDDALIEPHAPYWNARDVAALRAHQAGCSLLVGGLTRSIETQSWLEHEWAKPITPKRAVLRDFVPRVHATTEFDLARDEAAASARIPHRAWTVARDGLHDGPVLVHVPRRGYAMGLSCAKCRTPAVCECGGPLAADSDVTACTVCSKSSHGWRCAACGHAQLRASVIGNERTAEELGRAFPGVRVIMSDARTPVERVSHEPAIVVSTPGMEPVADGGYSAVLILDATASLNRPGLLATEHTIARWFDAAALATPGRSVVITADAALPAVQALIRWDPGWFAATEYAERVAAGLPPATRVISVVGSEDGVRHVSAAAPASFSRFGPNRDAHGNATMVLVGPREASLEVAQALHAALGERSVRNSSDLPTVRMDAEVT